MSFSSGLRLQLQHPAHTFFCAQKFLSRAAFNGLILSICFRSNSMLVSYVQARVLHMSGVVRALTCPLHRKQNVHKSSATSRQELLWYRIRVVWVGRELKDHLVPTPQPWAGTLWESSAPVLPHIYFYCWITHWNSYKDCDILQMDNF